MQSGVSRGQPSALSLQLSALTATYLACCLSWLTLAAKNLLTSRRVTHRLRGGGVQENLTRDEAIVVDAARQGVVCARVNDVLEGSVLIKKSKTTIGREAVANDNARLVHSSQSRSILRVLVVDGSESPVLPEKSVQDGGGVGANDRATIADAHGIRCLRSGISDSRVFAIGQQKSLG